MEESGKEEAGSGRGRERERERRMCTFCLSSVCVVYVMFEFCLLLNFTFIFSQFPSTPCLCVKFVTGVLKLGRRRDMLPGSPHRCARTAAQIERGGGA